MSVLPFDLDDALDAFDCPTTVTVSETSGTRAADGTWQQTTGMPRNLRCVILQMKPHELALLPPGNVQQGAIVIHTKDTLYVSGQNNAGVESRQSFLLYQGFTWRIVATGFQNPNSGFNTYNAVRYFPNGNDNSNNA